MRPKLILHIGMHKTGSTTLQYLMEKQRRPLQRQGFWYATTDRRPHEHLPKHCSLLQALTGDEADFEAEKRLLLDEFAASGCNTLILSEEGLSAPGLQKPQVHERIARLGADFDMEAICFLRRQDTWVESFWKQRCREGVNNRHITDFVHTPRIRRHMNYAPMLKTWGRDMKLTVLGYERATAAGLVTSFVEATGISITGDDHRNPGTSFEAAAIMAALRRNGMTDVDRRVVEKLAPKDGRRTALGSRLRAEILERLAEHNSILERRHGVVFPTDLPQEPEDALPEPSGAMLKRMTRRMKRMTRRMKLLPRKVF